MARKFSKKGQKNEEYQGNDKRRKDKNKII